MKPIGCIFALTLACLCHHLKGHSQSVDAFDPNVSDSVACGAIQPDGSIIVGGYFTNMTGQSRSRIARMENSGVVDQSFNPGASGPSPTLPYVVNCAALQENGKIVFGGNFNKLGGYSLFGFGRVRSDGIVDPADSGFTVTIGGVTAGATTATVMADGKILIAGGFTMSSTPARTNIAQFHSSGMLDTNFNAIPKGGNVYALAVQEDGKILLGGAFTNLNGQQRMYIGRLNANGSLDESFNPGASGIVNVLAIQTDNKILVGGFFTNLAGIARSRIGRLNSDGTPDMDFNPGVSGSMFPHVLSMILQTDGRILVGGSFTNLGGQVRNYMGRLHTDGSLDTNFVANANNTVLSLSLEADGSVLVGGSFTNLASQPRRFLARLNNPDSAEQNLTYDGTNITWSRSGASPEVWRTNFESSTDGMNWVDLGAGNRVSGGWQMTNVLLSVDSVIRARGFVRGGIYNGSSWYVECLSRPIIIQSGANFGMLSNQFGFDVLAGLGQAIVIESSSNLLHWSAVLTNVMKSSPFYFSDTSVSDVSWKYYRAVIQ
jgi:uncharacterized delta-60 repeat protein